MYTKGIFKPQNWHNNHNNIFIINYNYFYPYFVVLYSFEIKYQQASLFLHKRVFEYLVHKVVSDHRHNFCTIGYVIFSVR